jgi:hypothetical protein
VGVRSSSWNVGVNQMMPWGKSAGQRLITPQLRFFSF